MDKNPRKRTFRRTIWIFTLALVAVVVCLAILDQPHPNAHLEKVGTVHFETSCAPGVAPHSTGRWRRCTRLSFRQRSTPFIVSMKDDPNCAIAYWGIALS